MLRYRLQLQSDDNDTLLVTSPDIPLVTYGANEAEAIRHAAEAITLLVESMMAAGDDVPAPDFGDERATSVHKASLQTELKVRLHKALRAENLSRADLGRRLDWAPEAVDRLFRLDHDLQIGQVDKAFAVLGKSIGIAIGEAA